MGVFKRPEQGDACPVTKARYEDVCYVERKLHGRESRELFRDALDFYGTGLVKYALRHKPDRNRYMADARWFMNGTVRIVDCGAYTGDTVAAFLSRAGQAVSWIEFDAFEPDPASFAKLASRAVRLESDICEIRTHKACAYDQSAPVGFHSGLGPGSRIDPGYPEQAPSVRLEDEIRTGHPVSLLKICTNGSELGVLAGARGMITFDRPYLAVSVPASGADMLDLLVYAMSSQPGYRWSLRGYSRLRPDLVLYGRPDPWS